MSSADRFELVMALLEQARELSAERRPGFLDEQCGSDLELRREVESLLAHDESACEAVEAAERGAGVRALVETASASTDTLPEQIGPYRILRKLGEGGMGVVYEAEQHEPKRRVALKIMRPDFASPVLLRRFRYEAQALALLDHPGVAHIYEAGTVEANGAVRPFFAMELIDGHPLDVYAREHDLTLTDKLALMVLVCDAVQHAHLKGIIHRDLKPQNILVKPRATSSDGASTTGGADNVGQPKILDFGIARAVSNEVRPTTIQTQVGQVLGTLTYMSPEQIEGSADIDTRSDVYALGVILYELVSGRRPFDVAGKPLVEAARIVKEEDPPTLAAIDARMRGDVETIVAKAMERDRERRYESVAAMAEDIRRHLHSEPIAARPPSTLYQLTRFARRNRALVGGIAATFAALLIGLGGTLYFLYQSIESRDEATRRAETLQAITAYQQAQIDQIQPDAIAAWIRTEIERCQRLELQAAGASPEDASTSAGELSATLERLDLIGLSRALLQEHIFEPGVRAAREEFKDEPLVRGQILGKLGARGFRLSLWEFGFDALDEARRVLSAPDREHPEAVEYGDSLAGILFRYGRYDDAEVLLRQQLELARRTVEPGSTWHLYASRTLARCLFWKGELEEAESLLRSSLETKSRNDLFATVEARLYLADIRLTQRRFAEANELLGEAEAITKEAWGGGLLLHTVNNLIAKSRSRQADHRGAEKYWRDAMAGWLALRGARYDSTLKSASGLAVTLNALHRFEEALAVARRAAVYAAEAGVAGSIYRPGLLHEVARAALALNRREDADAAIRDALQFFQTANLTPRNPRTIAGREKLESLLVELGRDQDAATLRAHRR